MCSQVALCRADNPTNKGGLDEACLPVSGSEKCFNMAQILNTKLNKQNSKSKNSKTQNSKQKFQVINVGLK